MKKIIKIVLLLSVLLLIYSCDDEALEQPNYAEIARKLEKLDLSPLRFPPDVDIPGADNFSDCPHSGSYTETYEGVIQTVGVFFYDTNHVAATICETRNKEAVSYPFEYNVGIDHMLETVDYTMDVDGYMNTRIEDYETYVLGNIHYTYSGTLNFNGNVFYIKEGSYSRYALRSYKAIFRFEFENGMFVYFIEFEVDGKTYHFEIELSIEDFFSEADVVIELPLYDHENVQVGILKYRLDKTENSARFELYSREGETY